VSFKLEAATAVWGHFTTAGWFANWFAAVVVLVEQFLEHSTELALRCAARCNFAATSWFDNGATTVNGSNFATASWFANGSASRSDITTTTGVIAEEVTQFVTKLGLWCAARNWFAAAGWGDFATASRPHVHVRTAHVATVVAPRTTQTIKQSKSGISRTASEYEYCQQRRGDHTTHR
jgi:hypothetical protein